MAIKEGEHLLDDGETTLSSSELDDVLSSAEFQDMDAEDSSLEQYGVWVKVKPEDLGAEEQGADAFGLSDLDAGEDSGLTAEEEELLGELEDEPLEAGEFEGLEADLEALGRSVESGGPSLEGESGETDEEISIDDLDADLQELSFGEDTSGEDAGGEGLESLPEFDVGSEEAGSEPLEELAGDQEIEVPLSEDATVEEHFAGVSAAGSFVASGKASADILEKIEADLRQIKSEIQTLKRELTSIGRTRTAGGQVEVQPVPEGPPGFFNQDEDETIALTGDELDNILNTADVTEETAQPAVEELEEELPELDEEAVSLDLEETGTAGGEPPEAVEVEDILELGALDLEEEQPGEALSDIEIDIDSAGEAEEPVDLDLETLGVEAPAPAEEEEELILEDLGEAPEGEEELLLEEAEGEELAAEELTLDVDTGEGEAGLEELTEAAGGETLEEFDLAEEDLDASDFEELGAPEAEELASIPEAEELGEEAAEELLDLEELAEVGEETPAEELSIEEPELGGEEAGAPLELAEEADEIEEMEAVDELSGEETPEQPRAEGAMSPELKKDVSSVLSYLDQLLEALPEEKIREFAQSEYFGIYKRLFDELGLGA